MPALEPLRGLRVVATAAALDGARWTGAEVTVLRLADDEALAVGADAVDLDDPDAIVVDERGFVAAAVTLDDVAAHVEWRIPTERPALAQGSIAGVPATLWLAQAGNLLIVLAAYAAELEGRLGWREATG